MTHVTNGDPQNRWKNEIFSKSSNGPIWEVWFSETTHTNSFGTLFRSFGTFFISWGWLRTVVGKEKGKTEFKEYDGQRIASKSKFHHFPFAFLSFSLQRTTHKQESEKLRMGQQKAKKLFELQLHIYNFPIRATTAQCKAKVKRNIANPQVCSWFLSFWEIGFYLPVMISTMDPSLLNKSDFTLKQASYFHNCCNSNLARVSQKLKFWHN